MFGLASFVTHASVLCSEVEYMMWLAFVTGTLKVVRPKFMDIGIVAVLVDDPDMQSWREVKDLPSGPLEDICR